MIKKIILGVVVIGVLFGLTNCSEKKLGQDSLKKELKSVRIAFFPNITHSQALVGKSKGKFEKDLEGTKIEWKEFNAGPSEVEAFLSGALDIGYIGPGPALNAYTKSKGDIQIIAGASNGGAVFVSRQDLKITELSQLEGKKIAVPQFGNTQDLLLRNILNENKLKDTTTGGNVEIRQAENPDIKTLLEKGEIDAALVPEPWGSRLITEIKANIILNYNEIWKEGNYSTAVVISRKDFIEKNPEIVEKFLNAHIELTKNLNDNIDEYKNVVNGEIKNLTKKELSNEVLKNAFERIKFTYDPSKDSITGYNELSFNNGFIKKKEKLDNLYNFKILNKILKDKGIEEIK